MTYILLYILTIISANFLSSQFQPISLGPLMISLGTFTIGLSLFLRDMVQLRSGVKVAYLCIVLGLVLSAATSVYLKDHLTIVFASTLAFAISETTDMRVYTWLKLSLHWRVWWSGLVGGVLDSVVFIVVGLSPWGMNFIPWELIPLAALGQIIIKTSMQGIIALAISTRAR